jgi:hypothetical protein
MKKAPVRPKKTKKVPNQAMVTGGEQSVKRLRDRTDIYQFTAPARPPQSAWIAFFRQIRRLSLLMQQDAEAATEETNSHLTKGN